MMPMVLFVLVYVYMKHYIVTGGAGFIGSHLTERLVVLGHRVTVIDDLRAGKRENLPTGVELISLDVCSSAIMPYFQGVDGVFHLAAIPSVQESLDQPTKTNLVNVSGTLNVLWASHLSSVPKVVLSSSAAVYGNPAVIPTPEDTLIAPLSPYGLEKYLAEQYCQLFSRVYGLPTVCLRYANAYGPRMSDQGAYLSAIKVFLQQKERGEVLTITGDGEQTRDYIHVNDIVSANIKAMEQLGLGNGEVINIGSGRQVSINEVAKIIGGEVRYIPPRLEPRNSLLDISKAKNILNWESTEFLEDNLNKLKNL